MERDFPPIITDLPEADLRFEGIRGWLLQAPSRQGAFLALEAGACVPEHVHGPQWGFLLAGDLELTVRGHMRRLKPGDTYEIDDGEPHCARSGGGALVFDLFADPARYRVKT